MKLLVRRLRILLVSVFIILGIPLTGVAEQKEIKPGVVITRDNFDQYSSSLKELLIPGYYQHIIVGGGLLKGWMTIPVVETNKWKYQPPQAFIEASRKNLAEKRCSTGSENKLLGFIAGLPFPDPKSGLELAWSAFHRRGAPDDYELPADFILFNSDGKEERRFSWNLWGKHWVARTHMPPIPEMPGNNGVLDFKESIMIERPHDVRGFCQIRKRYVDITKADDCYSYIPALRRVRRLTGSDLTDPLLGSDAIPDDFEGWRQKINPRMTFRNLGIKKFLIPRDHTSDEISPFRGKRSKEFINKTCFQLEWEICPLWVLEVNTNDSDYPYEKRLVYVDMEDGSATIYGGDNYDSRGRLCHTYSFITRYFHPRTLYHIMCTCVYRNTITGHSSLMDIYGVVGPELHVPVDVFTVRGLLKKAR